MKRSMKRLAIAALLVILAGNAGCGGGAANQSLAANRLAAGQRYTGTWRAPGFLLNAPDLMSGAATLAVTDDVDGGLRLAGNLTDGATGTVYPFRGHTDADGTWVGIVRPDGTVYPPQWRTSAPDASPTFQSGPGLPTRLTLLYAVPLDKPAPQIPLGNGITVQTVVLSLTEQ